MAINKSINGVGPKTEPTAQRITNAKIIKPTKDLGVGPDPRALTSLDKNS